MPGELGVERIGQQRSRRVKAVGHLEHPGNDAEERCDRVPRDVRSLGPPAAEQDQRQGGTSTTPSGRATMAIPIAAPVPTGWLRTAIRSESSMSAVNRGTSMPAAREKVSDGSRAKSE